MEQWGRLVDIPTGTGEGALADGVLTMTRKKSGGDFKLYKTFTVVETGLDYRFLCKVKKTGSGSALVKVVNLGEGSCDTLYSQKIHQADEWSDIAVTFQGQAAPRTTVVQFYTSDEIDSSLAITQMLLLPLSQVADIVLKPVVVERKYKPVATAPSLPALPSCRDDNLLLNGDFSKRGFDIDLPLFWRNRHGYDTPEHRELYSLKDGILSFKTPFLIDQEVDIAPESTFEYAMSFKARVAAGTLNCSVGLRRLTDEKDYGLTSKVVVASDAWQDIAFTFSLKPEDQAGRLLVRFIVSGEGGAVELTNVLLLPIRPEPPGTVKEVYIEGKDFMWPVSGICVAEAHSFYDLKAAKLIQKYLFAAFGRYVELFVVKDAETARRKGLIYVGGEFLDDARKSGLKAGGYAVTVAEGIACVGGKRNDDGVVQGAFALLRSLGMEFFTVADWMAPADDVLVLKEMGGGSNPAFTYRFVSSGQQRVCYDSLGYSDCRMLDSSYRIGRWLWDEHTAPLLVDPTVHFKAHPEYYAMDVNGKRPYPPRGAVDIHLCMSNPDVQRVATETLLKWIEAEPWANVFFVACGDGHGWCQCPNCRAWDAGASAPDQGFLSDRNIHFVNILAKEVARKYPEKRIATLAYCGCRRAPLKEKPDDNVLVFYCTYPPVWNCNRHAFCPENLHGWEEFLEWDQKFSRNLCIYDYPAGGKTPMGGFYAAAQKLRIFAAAKVKGMIYCGNDSFLKEFHYVFGKMLWQPNLDIESELNKFMKFYYGEDVFPYVREYFDVLTEREMGKSLHRPDDGQARIDPQLDYAIVDHEFFCKGKALLDKALELSGKSGNRGGRAIEEQKLKLLTEYVLLYNKASGLKGEALAEFARNLGEMLGLAKKYNLPKPVWWLSMREMLVTRAQIDIGDVSPWHKSPVIDELLKDPVSVITKKTHSYEKTDTGLRFNVAMMNGGESLANYQNEGIPRSVRPSTKVLRRASSPFSRISTTFEIEESPASPAFLRLEGLDDEKAGRATFEILVNGNVVHVGENAFGEDDWGKMEIKIPSGFLVKGENTLIIQNTSKDKGALQGTIELIEMPKEDYSWGWMLLSACELIW